MIIVIMCCKTSVSGMRVSPAVLAGKKTNVCNKVQLRLMWLSVRVQNECNLHTTGRSVWQTKQGHEGQSLQRVIGFS